MKNLEQNNGENSRIPARYATGRCIITVRHRDGTMKSIVLLLALLTCECSFAVTNTVVIASGEWSEPVRDSRFYGLRGRLLLCETPQHRGGQGYDTAVHLELQEWSDFLGPPMQVYCNMAGDMALAPDFKNIRKAGCQWRLHDGLGRPVQGSPFASSGPPPGTYWVILHCDSSLRLRASLFGVGRFENGSLGIALSHQYWVIPPRSTNDYFLSATFTCDPPTNGFDPRALHVWRGTLTASHYSSWCRSFLLGTAASQARPGCALLFVVAQVPGAPDPARSAPAANRL